MNSDSAGDGQVLSWDSAGGSYAWVDKGNALFNISDNAQGVVVTGKVAAGSLDIDFEGGITARGGTKDFRDGIVNFSGASVAGLGDTIDDRVDFHLNIDSTVLGGDVLSWDGSEYNWFDPKLTQFLYSNQSDFPDPGDYHGAIAHSHSDGAMYFAHANSWHKLANDSQLLNSSNWDTAYSWGNHDSAGYATSSDISGLQSQINTLELSGSSVTIQGDPPSNPSSGDLWWNSDDGILNIYYQDADSSQWVDATGNGSVVNPTITTQDISNWNQAYANVNSILSGSSADYDTFVELVQYIQNVDSSLDIDILNNYNTLSGRIDTLEGAGYITDYTVTESDVTSHQEALSITQSQISDLSHYDDSALESRVTSLENEGAPTLITDGTSSINFDSNNLVNIDTAIKIHGVQELFSSDSGNIDSGDVVNFDAENSYIHRLSGTISGNFTANITNLNLADNYVTNVSVVIEQGASPYIIDVLQIDSAPQSIDWAGGTLPTGNENKTEILSFTILNLGSDTYKVLGQLTTFG